MTRIAHLSDPHFGTEDPRLIAPLLAFLTDARPDLIVLSGDLTQRARAGQFAAAAQLIDVIRPLGPFGALVVLYGVTLFATELLSNATVAVLMTPIAVALAESLGVDPRAFLVAVMMAASAAFATPFGYQTNVLVYNMAGYSYLDFVRVGLPLNIVTWIAAMVAIPMFFPF